MFEPSLVILSTKTDHHIYYINEIMKRFSVKAIFFENDQVQPKFPIGPLFEEEQALFEKKYFFKNVSSEIKKSVPIYNVSTVNEPGVSEKIKLYGVDLGLVFGCGKIKHHVLTVTRNGLINVHRGTSTEYRGLDSDLWAIYHKDYKNIGVTIHVVDEQLDTGDILRVQRLKLKRGMKIHQLRYYTTLMATEMTLDILREYKKTKKIKKTAQPKFGRYYSFMPLVLKKLVQARFNKYTGSLP